MPAVSNCCRQQSHLIKVFMQNIAIAIKSILFHRQQPKRFTIWVKMQLLHIVICCFFVVVKFAAMVRSCCTQPRHNYVVSLGGRRGSKYTMSKPLMDTLKLSQQNNTMIFQPYKGTSTSILYLLLHD